MIDAAAETPAPSRRSIPPVADWAAESLGSPPPRDSGWLWVLAILWVAAMVPVGLRWYGSGAGAPAQAAEGAAPEITGLATAVAVSPGHVTVPASAVAELDGKPTVFVADTGLHLLVATPVILGFRDGESREILSGVAEGDTVVTNGVGQLRAMASR